MNATVTTSNGKTKYINAYLDAYYKSFLKGITYMEACYKCNYANSKRVGDITLADFWGIKKEHPEFFDNVGVSAIIINNKKGKKLFEKIKENTQTIESTIKKIEKENENLKKPSQRNEQRNIAYKEINKKTFNKIAKENLNFKKETLDIIKAIIPQRLKNMIKKVIE